MSELLAAVIGALLAGALQFFDKRAERKRRRESTLVALASEVAAICTLIRHQRYLEETAAMAASIRNGTWGGETLIIDIRSNYFSVFESMTSDLGLLMPDDVAKFVSFYSYCKSAIDSTRPDGPHTLTTSNPDKAENIINLEGTLGAILALGDEISSLPKKPLPLVLSGG